MSSRLTKALKAVILAVCVVPGWVSPMAQAQTGSWVRVSEGGGPDPRASSAMAFDSRRGRTLLHGGGPPVGGTTWSWEGAAWRQFPDAVTFFGFRQQHGMVYDSARDRVVLYGGYDGMQIQSDTWELNESVWLKVATTGPRPRYGFGMAYDSARGRTVLFGGYSTTSGDARGDTWEWDGTSWNQVATTGPAARGLPAMAYDSFRQRVVLFGGEGAGHPLGDTWEWDGTAWTQVASTGPAARSGAVLAEDGGGRVLLYGGRSGTTRYTETWIWNGSMWADLKVSGPGQRVFSSMVYDSARGTLVLVGGLGAPDDTWEWRSSCADEAAPLDAQGNVIFPAELDPAEPIVYEDVDAKAGDVQDLYGEDAGTAEWYGRYPCNPSIGGTVPAEAEDPDLEGLLAAEGITGATPEEIAGALAEWDERAGTDEANRQNPLPTAPPASGPYAPPADPHCTVEGCKVLFGGRDVVFVHGLDTSPLYDKILGKGGKELTTWPRDEAEFYRDLNGNGIYGYWKQNADQYWGPHINRFLRNRGYKNRILVVAWPSTQRLDVAVHAMLVQISRAMIDGTGVEDLSGRNDTSKFGSPSFVILSHSTGSLLTDVALAAAHEIPGLQAGHVADFCKAHVALHGAVSGSQYATAVVAAAGAIELGTDGRPDWLCSAAVKSMQKLSGLGFSPPALDCSQVDVLEPVVDSVLVDLVPLVAKKRWGSYVDKTPVRTLSVTGAHPSAASPLKILLASGFDDGVVTVNSQDGNSNTSLAWPSGFFPAPPFGFVRIFDMGIPAGRAIGYYVDQTYGARLALAPRAAAGPIPQLSPTGMLQPILFIYPNPLDPRRRYGNHLSYLFSASDHAAGECGSYCGSSYVSTGDHKNREETLAITDRAAFLTPYAMVYPGDDQPLLSGLPPVDEIVRGRKVTFKIKIFGKKFTKTWWIWKRRYHLLAGWENKVEADYVYDNLLTTGGYTCPPPGPENDCNGNGADDFCEQLARPSIKKQPVVQTLAVGQKAMFSVVVTGPGPFTYQWRRNGVNLVEGGRFSGVKTKDLTIDPTQAGDVGTYDVVITGTACSITSAPGKLAFIPGTLCTLDAGMTQASFTAILTGTLAQTFKPDNTGALTGVTHGLRKLSGSVKSYNLYITRTNAAGQPTWPAGVLYSLKGLTTFASGSVNAAVPVVGGPKLNLNATYALVLEPVGAGSMAWRGNSGGTYPKGQAYLRKPGAIKWMPSTSPKDFGFKLAGVCCASSCVLDPGLPSGGITAGRKAKVAQTFKPVATGTLNKVVHGLRKQNGSAASYNLYVTTTQPNGKPSWPQGVLYSVQGLTFFATGTGIDGTVPVAGGPKLQAGVSYAIVLEPVGNGSMYWRGNSSAGSYPNGAAWEWNGGQSSWLATTTGPRDHGFKLEGNCCK